MRTISANALAKLQQNLGTEPIVIVEVEWVDGARTAYADRDIGTAVKGAILEVTGLESVIQVSQGGDSQQISVKLDATDGSLKQIIDTVDIHKRPCRVYQWFDGLDLADKFLLFAGQLNTPLEWDEGDRTLSFTVVSKIEDVEIGFSIEEGISDTIDEELIGKPWPLCFGTVNNVPCLRLKPPASGTLMQGTGIHDFTLPRRIAAAKNLCCPPIQGTGSIIYLASTGASIGQAQYASSGIYRDPNCEKQNCVTRATLELEFSEQKKYETNPIKISGGDLFPQGVPLTLDINGGKFTGTFSGENFTITSRLHPENDGTGRVKQDPYKQQMKTLCEWAPELTTWQECEPQYIQTVLGPVLDDCSCKQAILDAIEPASFFWANAGSKVVIDSDQEVVYIANLIQSTVLRVAAYRNLNGVRQLVDVPTDYYTVRYTDYTGYTAVTEIVFNRPLSTRDLDSGASWDDDVFVTLTSDVGPNTVDIIEWILETYAPHYNTSFAGVRELIDNYPMHYAVVDRRPNLISFLQDIATQARCALWLKDDTFYLRYLSAEPDSDDTITEDDVLPNSLVLYHTATEDLVTKQVNEWIWDYAATKKNKLILRHNVKKYGTHERTNDYFCFTDQELVRKSATFWLIRQANTWRKVKFKTPIHKVRLEPFDVVTLNLPDVAPSPVKCIIEKATLDSDALTIDFDVWTPMKAGTTVPYDFAWPADVDEQALFPTPDEREFGFAGSGTEPNFSVVAPPGHILASWPQATLGGGNSGAPCAQQPTASGPNRPPLSNTAPVPGGRLGRFNCHKDQGDATPSDKGDTKPNPKVQTGTGQTSGATVPPHLDINIRDELRKQNERMGQIDKKATDAQTTAGSAAQASGANEPKKAPESELEKLPEPHKNASGECDRLPGDCVAIVRVGMITVQSVRDANGVHKSEGSGTIVNGTLSDGACISFNSVEAARDYWDSLGGIGHPGTVGQTVPNKASSSVSSDLGLGPVNENGFRVPCEDPGRENAQIVAYLPAEKRGVHTPPPVEES